MIFYPTVVLLPQWVLDEINAGVACLEGQADRFLFTDEMRANGWTREMLIGGMMFTTALKNAEKQ